MCPKYTFVLLGEGTNHEIVRVQIFSVHFERITELLIKLTIEHTTENMTEAFDMIMKYINIIIYGSPVKRTTEHMCIGM
jgi:hypothetical protein